MKMLKRLVDLKVTGHRTIIEERDRLLHDGDQTARAG
jgi:hypothetical protein